MDNIDLRQEFDDLLAVWGYYATYIRFIREESCHVCGGAPGGCPHCYGSGKAIISERIFTRRDTASIPDSWPRATVIQPVGSWQVPAYMYYMRYDSSPSSLDLIIDNNQVLEINLVDPQFGLGGRIEYYRIAVEHKPTKQQYL